MGVQKVRRHCVRAVPTASCVCRRLFRQPMVPVVGAADGRWPLAGPLAPMMKPGGHGAIWKLMLDEGIFAWLAAHRREAALVRQIRCKELPVLVSGLDLRAFGCGRALLSTPVTRDRAPQAALSRGGHVSLPRRPVAVVATDSPGHPAATRWRARTARCWRCRASATWAASCLASPAARGRWAPRRA